VAQRFGLGSSSDSSRPERFRRAGFGALFVGGVCAVLSLLAGAAYLCWPAAYQSVLAGFTVWCIAAAWYALRRAGYGAGAAAYAAGRLERMSTGADAGGPFEHLYLKARLEEEQARVMRTGGSLSLLCMAVEGLDQVRARFGTQVRSRVLEEVAGMMSASLRLYDTLARVGSSEYVAILPNADRRTATHVAQRLSRGVEKYRHELSGGKVIDFICLSVGLAAYPFNGEAADNVVAAARNAMAEAQREGGGRIRVSDQFIRTDQRGEQVITQMPGSGEG